MNTDVRLLWFAVMIFFSLVVGVGAGVLARADGRSLPVGVLTGGACFGGTLVLCLTVLSFATSES